MPNIKNILDGNWTEVTIRLKQYDDIHEIASWLRENCKHEYNWSSVPGSAVRRCRFADKDDALLFALKWS